MTPEFDTLCNDARALGLKIGPIAERPDGKWRVYLQKDSEILRCGESATIEAAFEVALHGAKIELGIPVANRGTFPTAQDDGVVTSGTCAAEPRQTVSHGGEAPQSLHSGTASNVPKSSTSTEPNWLD